MVSPSSTLTTRPLKLASGDLCSRRPWSVEGEPEDVLELISAVAVLDGEQPNSNKPLNVNTRKPDTVPRCVNERETEQREEVSLVMKCP